MSDNLQNTLSYMSSELNRIQTMAGMLSNVEAQHHKDLTNMGDDQLNQMALEEQNASRQLGEIKDICLALSQKIEELQNNLH